jgi:thiol-disulfide isomerase/thioredoxin
VKAAQAVGTPAQVSEARHALGNMLLLSLAAAAQLKGQPKEAVEAVSVYGDLLAAAPEDMDARFNHGRALAYLDRNDEAAADFRTYLQIASTAPLAELAKQFAAKPTLAAHRLLPPMRIKTSTGKYFDTAFFHGDVILLDFWASWCPSCMADVTRMKTLHGRRLAVLSISTDSNRESWQKAVARNQMTWPQALDDDGRYMEMFGIMTIPHFVLLNADGLVLYEGDSLDAMAKPVADALDEADREDSHTKQQSAD